MKVEPPCIFSDFVKQALPIATRSRTGKPADREFMKNEVRDLQQKGIVEESRSPWRAQAFVVHGQKRRMVVDYSQTVNKFTDLDAYPFPDVDQMLNRIAENHLFSRIDLKSAYHQIPLREEDRPYTAFEVSGKLYQFTRLPFGVTNAVACFNRIVRQFIDDNKLENAEPYLDDVIIGGKTQEEHDRNLQRFLAAAQGRPTNLEFR